MEAEMKEGALIRMWFVVGCGYLAAVDMYGKERGRTSFYREPVLAFAAAMKMADEVAAMVAE